SPPMKGSLKGWHACGRCIPSARTRRRLMDEQQQEPQPKLDHKVQEQQPPPPANEVTPVPAPAQEQPAPASPAITPGPTPAGRLEAVRRAGGALGADAPPAAMAAFIEPAFGFALKPAIVNVLKGTLLQLQRMDADRRRAQEIVAAAGTAEGGSRPKR